MYLNFSKRIVSLISYCTSFTRIVEGPRTVTSLKVEVTDIGPDDCRIANDGTKSGSQEGTAYSGTPRNVTKVT